MGGPGDDRAAPLVAVTGRRRSAAGLHLGPPSLDALEVEGFFTGYADHVAAAGGLAVYLPSRTDPRVAMDRVDALVLTGGTDVDPARYGAPTCATTPPLDPERDEFELALLGAALERDLPVLAICRGHRVGVRSGAALRRGGLSHVRVRGHDRPADAGLHGPVRGLQAGRPDEHGPAAPVPRLTRLHG